MPDNPGVCQITAPAGMLSSFADLRVASAGYHLGRDGEFAGSVDLPAMVLITRGSGALVVEGGARLAVSAGCCFPLFAGKRYRYGPLPGTTWDEWTIRWSGAGLARWQACGWWPKADAVLRVVRMPWVQAQFQEAMTWLARNDPAGDGDRALLASLRLLAEIHHNRPEAQTRRIPAQEMEAVLGHCRLHFASPVDFRALARQHGLSYSRLRHQVKEMTGLSPVRFITRLRCEAAARLLGDESLPIAEVGRRVGFRSAVTFSLTFRARYGCSPRQYRQGKRPAVLKRH